MWEMSKVIKIVFGKPDGKESLERLKLDRRIILKWV
jgi:hypothetical protein